MKKVHQCRRILILSLLCFTVLAPLIFVSSRLEYFTPIGRKEFGDDLSTFKYRTEAVKLSAIEKEAHEDLRGPALFVYRRKDLGSLDTYTSTGEKADSKHSQNIGDTSHDSSQSESAPYMTDVANPLQINGASHEGKVHNKLSEHEPVVSKV